MEIFKNIAIILSPIISGIFLFYSKRINKTQKEFNNSKEALNILNVINSKNKDYFIIKTFEEKHFLLQTGIESNHKNIEKYIKFYNKTEFPWSIISRAQKHLDISGDEIQIKLKSYWFKIKDVILIFALSLFIIGGVLFPLFSDIAFKSLNNVLIFISIFMMLSFTSYMLISSIDSILAVDIIKKKLFKIENLNKD